MSEKLRRQLALLDIPFDIHLKIGETISEVMKFLEKENYHKACAKAKFISLLCEELGNSVKSLMTHSFKPIFAMKPEIPQTFENIDSRKDDVLIWAQQLRKVVNNLGDLTFAQNASAKPETRLEIHLESPKLPKAFVDSPFMRFHNYSSHIFTDLNIWELRRSRKEMYEITPIIKRLAIPEQMARYINKAISRIDQGSYSEAIINCYRVSETLVNTLFAFLYPDSRNERIKHEDKLRRVWNDDPKEKHEYPGIRVIASLFAVILWYRNKMAAHTEMTPTPEAARICVTCLVQALIEFERLDIKIGNE